MTGELVKMRQPIESLEPTMVQIREALEKVLMSKAFRRASRLKSLLTYVVRMALDGRVSDEHLTARELFGKDEFNPALDPSIRVQFGRLRRALMVYYDSEGRADKTRIEIPRRTYVPVFQSGKGNRSLSASDVSDSDGNEVSTPIDARDSSDSRGTDNRRIAVLPFANLTNDPTQDPFCYGLTEEITNELAALASVDVVASSSSFQFKGEHVDVREAGKELGVPFILEGSVRMEEGNTRVIAQLARSEDGVAVWSGSFEDKMNGSLNTQKVIAQRVLEGLPLGE